MSTKKKSKILILGAPGVGKTTMGSWLSHKYGYIHVDMEENGNNAKIMNDYRGFIDNILTRDKAVVLTWGFSPDKETLNVLEKLRKIGFRFFWFEGDIEIARKYCIERGGFNSEVFDRQINLLKKWNIPESLKVLVIHVFDKEGRFLDKDELVKKLKI